MGIRQYKLGLRHGLEGVRALAHRKCRQYDRRSDTESYLRGYHHGAENRRLKKEGKVGLDYANPLNNQLFTDE